MEHKAVPQFISRRTVGEMKDGEEGYTYPAEDDNGRPWSMDNGAIDVSAPFFSVPTGGATMRIRCDEAGYTIWPPDSPASPATATACETQSLEDMRIG